MSPKQLKDKHQLSYGKLALLLNKDQRTVERYCASTQFPEYLNTFCYLLDFYLESRGSVPPTCWGGLQ